MPRDRRGRGSILSNFSEPRPHQSGRYAVLSNLRYRPDPLPTTSPASRETLGQHEVQKEPITTTNVQQSNTQKTPKYQRKIAKIITDPSANSSTLTAVARVRAHLLSVDAPRVVGRAMAGHHDLMHRGAIRDKAFVATAPRWEDAHCAGSKQFRHAVSTHDRIWALGF